VVDGLFVVFLALHLTCLETFFPLLGTQVAIVVLLQLFTWHTVIVQYCDCYLLVPMKYYWWR